MAFHVRRFIDNVLVTIVSSQKEAQDTVEVLERNGNRYYFQESPKIKLSSTQLTLLNHDKFNQDTQGPELAGS